MSSFLTNIWENYAGMTGKEQSSDGSNSPMPAGGQHPLKEVCLKLENGVVAMSKVDDQYLVCVCGAKTVVENDLRAKLSSLVEELTNAMSRS